MPAASRPEALHVPAAARACAEAQPVVQARGAAVPELDCVRPHQEAAPVGRPGDVGLLVRVLLRARSPGRRACGGVSGSGRFSMVSRRRVQPCAGSTRPPRRWQPCERQLRCLQRTSHKGLRALTLLQMRAGVQCNDPEGTLNPTGELCMWQTWAHACGSCVARTRRAAARTACQTARLAKFCTLADPGRAPAAAAPRAPPARRARRAAAQTAR